jgi:hypothetical protein
MNEDEILIRSNLPSLLSSSEVRLKTDEISGEWTLHENEIQYIHPMPSNIEFKVLLVNGSACLLVSAKINRVTAKFSNIDVEEK